MTALRMFASLAVLAACTPALPVQAQEDPALRAAVEADYDAGLDDLFTWFHENPELSMLETNTAARMAAELRAAGLEVTEHVGGTGVVGILRNGDGPLILLRADMDAL
ncbi:MAG: amidohydrolase, partial [Erythrobacter sp.]|nr:amidohydrolase [Erythrobacter sp.]